LDEGIERHWNIGDRLIELLDVGIDEGAARSVSILVDPNQE